MKNKYLQLAILSLVVTTFMFLQGCIKDTINRTHTYTLYRPVYKTMEEVVSNIKSNTPKQVQRPGKIFIKGQYIFLNEIDKGVHIIDNSNPAQPRNVAFIDIPGNVDIAVKGNTLYADFYTDLVTLDISNPLQTKVTKIIQNVFSHRYYTSYFKVDTTKVIVGWITKDTTIAKTNPANFRADFVLDGFSKTASSAPIGIGGSMARFTIVNERLYTVGNQELKVFNITDIPHPSYVSDKYIGIGIETIYPFKDRLFIGSTTGMFIYDINNPDQPSQLGRFSHVRSCDPVIADDTHAYVTLRSGTACNGFTNQLEVLDITNLSQPDLVKTYSLTNPHGLSKDGNLLFICDGKDGLKLYDASTPNNLQLLRTIGNMETYDVIAFNGVAIVVAKDGLYQFDYTDRSNIKSLSKIAIAL